jgi:AcrR family transcriptional regulator
MRACAPGKARAGAAADRFGAGARSRAASRADSVAPVRENARTRILEAAVRLIARDGLDEARMARIAMAAGVSPSLLHYHFESRDALLAEALEHSYETAGDERIAAIDRAPTPTVRLQAMIDQCLPHPGKLRDDFILWVELWLHAARRPELRETSARLYARMHGWFAETITALGARDVARTTDRLLALLDGYGVRALAGDPEMPIDRARAEIWAAIEPDLHPPAFNTRSPSAGR